MVTWGSSEDNQTKVMLENILDDVLLMVLTFLVDPGSIQESFGTFFEKKNLRLGEPRDVTWGWGRGAELQGSPRGG